jgi:hypothetical protein
MMYEDLISAARIARKYAVAVESKLYWNMSPIEADEAIKEAERIADLLEEEAAKENTEVR